jgi:hypothetical protein
MKFIELSGKTLLRVVRGEGPSPEDLSHVGMTDESILRVNPQGDIELRRHDRWDLIGGLLGDFQSRLRIETGLDWAGEE